MVEGPLAALLPVAVPPVEHAGGCRAALEHHDAHAVAPVEALANATPDLQAFGHVVVAWLWLDIALASGGDAGRGRLAAARYFFDYELPKIGP